MVVAVVVPLIEFFLIVSFQMSTYHLFCLKKAKGQTIALLKKKFYLQG